MVDAQLTQDDAITFVESIGETLGLTKVNDSMGVSYYGISENTVVRIADHSTYLQTWIDHDTYEKENKYSIVIEVNPSKPNPIVNRNVELFIVKEFKHKLKKLNGDAVVELANAIKGAIGSGGQFSNPFKVKTRLIASKYQPPQNDNQQSTQDATKQNITNNQQYTNMKTENRKRNVVRLTESQLRQMIAESVKKALKEDYSSDDFYSGSYWGSYADSDGEYNGLYDGANDIRKFANSLITLMDTDYDSDDEEAFKKHSSDLHMYVDGLYYYCKQFCDYVENNYK